MNRRSLSKLFGGSGVISGVMIILARVMQVWLYGDSPLSASLMLISVTYLGVSLAEVSSIRICSLESATLFLPSLRRLWVQFQDGLAFSCC
jgi:hypothetical protein